MNKFFIHLKTIFLHKHYVNKGAFRLGIPIRGLFHDMSKFLPSEFRIFKYATGEESPNHTAREELGYSPVHMLHVKRNEHHWEHGIDLVNVNKIITLKIPYDVVVEMFCDMCSTGKVYGKEDWKLSDPYQYYLDHFVDKKLMHEESAWLLSNLLKKLSECQDENEFVEWYKSIKGSLKRIYSEN